MKDMGLGERVEFAEDMSGDVVRPRTGSNSSCGSVKMNEPCRVRLVLGTLGGDEGGEDSSIKRCGLLGESELAMVSGVEVPVALDAEEAVEPERRRETSGERELGTLW